MKKLIVSFIILVLAVMLVAGATFKASADYALVSVVIEIDYNNDLVTCQDFNGNLWQFEGCEDWMINDIVGMIMNDKGTDIIYDDEIININYNGWIEG